MRFAMRALRVRKLWVFGALLLWLVGGGRVVSVSAGAPLACPNATLRLGTSTGLPDCRAYEQVSPADKGGFAAVAPANPTWLSPSGDKFAYLGLQAFPGAVGNTAIYSAHVSARVADHWRTEEWTPKIPKVEVLSQIFIVDYTFSRDLSQAILQVPLVPLVSGATPYAYNLFHRDSTGALSLVNSAPPAVPVENICGVEELAFCWRFADIAAFAGASSDFSHVLFESNAQLTEEAPETFVESLYESFGGTVRLIGILPDGTPAATSTAGAGSSSFYATPAQNVDRSVERAVSEDGSHVIFQAPADGGEPDPEQVGLTQVYDRINGTETIEISAPAPGATPAVTTPAPATFQTASVDGSRVFFTSSAELTTQSSTGEANNSEDLYEYNLQTKQLTDLTIDTNPLDTATGAMVQGVVGSSTDGSYVYFVANGQLVEGKGTDGQPNLYMVHNGSTPVFITTLGSSGECRFTADPCVWSQYPVEREAYVTPDGQHMAFMSSQSLPTVNFPSGYDNTDQETGKSDSEVYEYTAPSRSGGTGQLVCVSCDPSGARPVGNALLGGISPKVGGIVEGKETYLGTSTPFYRVRAMSDDGRRVFYAAPPSLGTPYNSVYEYQHGGTGSCENVRGCQSLISGPNVDADYFLGSSTDGSNAFFATSSRLTPSDTDTVIDIYNARIDGGIPALPEEPRCESGCHQLGPPPAANSHVSGAVGPSGNEPAPKLSPSLPKKCKRGFKRSPRGKCVKVAHKHKKQGKKAKTTHRNRRAR